MLCCADKLLTKLRLEQELNLGQVGRSGSSLMPVTDVVAVDTLTSQQLRIVKYTATKLLIGLLADQSLVTQVNGASLGGSVAAAPPLFRLGDPALCGSRPLVTPY